MVYMLIVQLVTTAGRSFINTRNSSGPRMEPCSTSLEIEVQSGVVNRDSLHSVGGIVQETFVLFVQNSIG